MTSPVPSRPSLPSRAMRRSAALGVITVAAWLGLANLRLAVEARYQYDELQYAHGAWRIAQGEVVYRDFFEHHFPLLPQALSLVWRFVGDEPTNLQWLRLAMLPIFALAILAAVVLNRPSCGRWAWATAPVLLAIPVLSWVALQVRPDILAAALYLAALAALGAASSAAATDDATRRRWAALAGGLAAAALWASLKVAYYGLPLVAALAADLLARRRRRVATGGVGGYFTRYLTADPIAFLAAASAVGLVVAVSLLVTGSADEWWRWGVLFSFEHQAHYPPFHWLRNLEQLLWRSLWLVPFASVGVVATVRRLRDRPAAEVAGDPDVLVLASLATALFSCVWQAAPYLYSFTPFALLLGIFAARGAVATARRAVRSPWPVFAVVLLVLVGGVEATRAGVEIRRMAHDDNAAQRRTLALLGAKTAVEDPVFHVWGGQVSRPAVHYFFFQEDVTMQLQAERLERELVPAMIDRGVTVYLDHELFPRLVPSLRRYLAESFVAYDDELWFYGRRFEVVAGEAGGELPVVRGDRYFVSPPRAVAGLEIDGRPVPGPIFHLERGRHRLRYRGDADAIAVVWLPRDGEPFTPLADARLGD